MGLDHSQTHESAHFPTVHFAKEALWHRLLVALPSVASSPRARLASAGASNCFWSEKGDCHQSPLQEQLPLEACPLSAASVEAAKELAAQLQQAHPQVLATAAQVANEELPLPDLQPPHPDKGALIQRGLLASDITILIVAKKPQNQVKGPTKRRTLQFFRTPQPFPMLAP